MQGWGTSCATAAAPGGFCARFSRSAPLPQLIFCPFFTPQVAKRLGRVLCMAGFPVALPLQPPGLRAQEREAAPGELRPASTGSVASPFGSAVPASRASPKHENGNPSLLSDTAKNPS